MTTQHASRSLARRAIPTQARSTVTVEKILAAATDILSERGLQGLNTNAVADAACINVATLYHYFPDKVAILAELFRRDQARRYEFLIGRLNELPEVEAVDEWTADLIHSVVEVRRAVPTTAVLRRACRTVPQLLAIEEADTDRLVEEFSKSLRRRYPLLSPTRARHCARTLIETGGALLDRASLDEGVSMGLIAETIEMLSAYVERLERDR
jgi:AcrR family transcriptional regulator